MIPLIPDCGYPTAQPVDLFKRSQKILLHSGF